MMSKKLFFPILLTGFFSIAAGYSSWGGEILLSPPDFSLDTGDRAVFVDFLSAKYRMHFSSTARKATSIDVIEFYQDKRGAPVFDLVVEPTDVLIDGIPVRAENVTPPGSVTRVRVASREFEAGFHTLEVFHPITEGVSFGADTVRAGFFMSDLDDRSFLEKFLTSNLEYDTYSIQIHVETDTTSKHRVMTNGAVSKVGRSSWDAVYPDYFSGSSLYFHLVPEAGMQFNDSTYTSIDGRILPVEIYASLTNTWWPEFVKGTPKYLAELEKDYGAFPHSKVVVYGVGIMYGGMEYCGATITSSSALGHELTHSYFARGVMPANGASGWMDEAIASWRDSGYKQLQGLTHGATNMATYSPYKRDTDSKAYREGRDLLAHLDYLLQDQALPGLKSALRNLAAEKMHKRLFTPALQSHLEQHIAAGTGGGLPAAGIDVEALFNKYVYGEGAREESAESEPQLENPMHPRLTREQLDSLI